MKVVAYDPFLSPERAVQIGVEKVELDELLAQLAHSITLKIDNGRLHFTAYRC